METRLTLVVLVLILAAILTPEEDRRQFRRWLFWSAIIGTVLYYAGPLFAGFGTRIYDLLGMKGVAVILACTSLALVAFMGWRHDIRENAKIRGGDIGAFNRRVETLMRDRNYSLEQATAAVRNLKDGN